MPPRKLILANVFISFWCYEWQIGARMPICGIFVRKSIDTSQICSNNTEINQQFRHLLAQIQCWIYRFELEQPEISTKVTWQHNKVITIAILIISFFFFSQKNVSVCKLCPKFTVLNDFMAAFSCIVWIKWTIQRWGIVPVIMYTTLLN